MYWSISPVAKLKYTKGGIAIGFMDDSEYLGSVQKMLKDRLMVMPQEISRIKDIKKFQYITALLLLMQRDISLVSVWHPSFFILILNLIEKKFDKLILDIREGGVFDKIEIEADPKRASELVEIFDMYKNRDILYEKIWSRLVLISCWGDAQASLFFEKLKLLFPNTKFELKGLIATEGFISFPNSGGDGSNLSILSHFFEFKEINSDRVYLAHELKNGSQYSVILTTSGGLYRYEIGDIVEVVGFNGDCPLIKFLGKKDYFVDMCGEKLSEIEVDNAVKGVLFELDLKPNFWIVAPEIVDSCSSRYVLFIQGNNQDELSTLYGLISQKIDKILKDNFHYKYCRDLGQLLDMGIFSIDREDNPVEKYFDFAHKEGQQLGDIKPKSLHKKNDWGRVFLGEYLI